MLFIPIPDVTVMDGERHDEGWDDWFKCQDLWDQLLKKLILERM